MGKSARRQLTVGMLLIFISAALGGCGVIRDRSDDYLKADPGQKLKIPEWYERDQIQEKYPIPSPDVVGAAGDTFTLPKPPDLTAEILEENYVIENAEGETWLLVNESPGGVWPLVDRFFEESGVFIIHESPRQGLMQSDALDLGQRSRQVLTDVGVTDLNQAWILQSRIVPGVRRKTAEVQVRLLQRQPEARLVDWQAKSRAEAQERKLLERMRKYLQAREGEKSYSRLALDIEAPRVVRLNSEGETPFLELDLSYDRAWNEMNKALLANGQAVVDINRSEGMFYVTTAEDSSSWWSWLDWFDWSDDEERPEYEHTVKLSRHASGHGVQVRVEAAPDNDDPRPQQVLSQLFEKMS